MISTNGSASSIDKTNNIPIGYNQGHVRLTHADRERGPVLKAPSDMEDAYPLAAAIRKSVRLAQATETMNRREFPLQNVEGFACMAQFPVTPGGSSRGSNFGWNHEHARPYADGLFLIFPNQ